MKIIFVLDFSLLFSRFLPLPPPPPPLIVSGYKIWKSQVLYPIHHNILTLSLESERVSHRNGHNVDVVVRLVRFRMGFRTEKEGPVI